MTSVPAPPAEPRAAAKAEAAPRGSLVPIRGWGGQSALGRELRSEDLRAITRDVPLSRGLGRSYGDSSLPPPSRPLVANTTLADRILDFDPQPGMLRAEAGLSIAEMHRFFYPRGFFAPVTPGTQFVTLGGAVAADVHGKNHHVAGCIGAHVRRLWLRVADGRILQCSREKEPELFRATLGGMGLTGHILEVELRLDRIGSPWIRQESERIKDIDAFAAALEKAAGEWPMTVGWIDCLARGRALGRGILIKGRWADPDEGPRGFPRAPWSPSVLFLMPEVVLSRLGVRTFNELYYGIHVPRVKHAFVGPQPFFYPLDRIRNWNRLYGRRGFTQYQAIIPRAAGVAGVRRFLETLSARGGASFLAVIKDCGAEGIGMLSFPKPGLSIALDVPIRDDTQALVDALNERVIAEGGRIYLAKDGFTRPEHFAAMEPRLPTFLAVRRRFDPELRLRSAQSVRLFGDPA
jgi:decaprenylphospho-beta-D-ribofuranose 2-oxidase